MNVGEHGGEIHYRNGSFLAKCRCGWKSDNRPYRYIAMKDFYGHGEKQAFEQIAY